MPGLGPAGDAFVGAFGAVTALLVIGGPMLLRWQRNRQQFVLVQAALEKGVAPPWSEEPPSWIVSLRQGLLTVALGVGLMVTGGVAWGFTHGLEPPVVASETVEPAPAPHASPEAHPGSEPHPGPEPKHHPPAPNPAMEEWHRMQAVNSTGLFAAAAGFVLLLVGLVRAFCARVERDYAKHPRA
jgi:hypothetical protein